MSLWRCFKKITFGLKAIILCFQTKICLLSRFAKRSSRMTIGEGYILRTFQDKQIKIFVPPPPQNKTKRNKNQGFP